MRAFFSCQQSEECGIPLMSSRENEESRIADFLGRWSEESVSQCAISQKPQQFSIVSQIQVST